MNSFSEGNFKSIHTFKGGLKYEIKKFNEIKIIYNQAQWIRYISKENICFDIFCYFKENDKLLIMGQDALIEGRTDLPYFYRTKWHQYFNSSIITINDPTLYLKNNLKSGWFQLENSIEILQEILDYIIAILKIKDENIVFYGASAGGYWNLCNAMHYNNSTFIVDIPQINLETIPYIEQKDELKELLKLKKLKSIFDFWKEEKTINHIIYLQNKHDQKHINSQLSYFLENLNNYNIKGKNIIKKFELEFYEVEGQKRGHTPLDINKIITLINKFL